MAEINNIQEYGDQLVIVMSDGTKRIAYPTPSGLYIIQEYVPPVAPPPTDPDGNTPPPPTGPAGDRFMFPFSLSLVTSEYGPRWGRLHAGMDFGRGEANRSGTAIRAAGAGTVIIANKTNSHGGYGNAVVINHGGGRHTLYGHMRFKPGGGADVDVSVGQKVAKGQRLGGVGATGASKGVHLHFETHEGGYRWNASAKNPRLMIKKWNS